MITPRPRTFWILAGRTPQRVDSLDTWLKLCHSGGPEWSIAHDTIFGVKISTIFLGIDRRFFGNGPPILFETMIFGGKHHGEQFRTCTWQEAEAAHAAAVALIKKSAVAS